MKKSKSPKPAAKDSLSKVKDSSSIKTSASKNKKDFLVVGLGASAGGVKALQDFFATMPPNSGMAFVVILHLAPNHESNLDHILQTQTTMPVIKVLETHKVEPNHVYVIPPNQNLEMVDGIVRIAKQGALHGRRVVIDTFFRTLADAYERNAVCVVLSGTGSDGTLGLKRIKESNGFAVVQDPNDAEYDQMPRSAIATQLADWVLPVAMMAEKLLSFKESSEKMHLTDGDPEKVAKEINAEESLREILTILRVRTGHDFSNYKTPTLVRRIARHLQIHELEDIPTYLAFLRDNPNEIQSLQRNLLINVTNFFRDKEAFETLESEVIPNLFIGKTSRDTVRVWSAGCASGEEAFSLAMILSEYAQRLSDPPKFQIFATDVDDEAIAEAREHSYPETIEADVSEERLKRFFNKEGKRYRIKKELRETVLFAPHNILRDPPFSKLDLITCRNLLIYLNRETQERVMEIFHFALTINGYLFLGSSETAENVPNLFSIVDKKHRIYSRRATSLVHQIAPPKMPIVGTWQVKIPDRKEISERNKTFSLGEVHYKLLEKYAPPSVLVNQDFEVVYMSEAVGRYLRFSGGEPTNNILKLVHPDLLPDLRAALFTAQHEKRASEFPNVHLKIDGEEITVNLIVRAADIEGDNHNLLLIIFDEVTDSERVRNLVEDNEAQTESTVRVTNKDEAMEAIIKRLEADLSRTRNQLRATIEQHEVSVEELKASNEELQAINEELRSAGEELETSKEELQSVNEELITVNHELKEKIDETSRTNSDLQNLMSATEIATIFLDRNLLIKRFTPPVEDLFSITKTDIGRPLTHFTHRLNYDSMAEDAAYVLRKLTPIEKEITDRDNRTYLTRFVPYRTIDDRIEGVILNFVDISARKAAEIEVAENLRDTQLLRELATQLITEGNIEVLYDKVLEAAITIAQADAGTIQQYDEKTQELVLLATRNISGEIIDYFARVDAGSKTSCGIALKKGERIFLDYDAKPKRSEPEARIHLEAGFLSAQSTPLISRSGEPLGMFTTHWSENQRRPSEHELQFLDLLARQAADLIEQRQSEKALRELGEKYRLELEQKVEERTKQLNESSALLKATMDSSMDMIQVFEAVRDQKDEIVDFKWILNNHTAEEIYGNVIGESLLKNNPGVVEEGIFDTFKRVVETGEPDQSERRYVHEQFDGWFYQSVVKLGDGVATTTTDITKRKNAEQEILRLKDEVAQRTEDKYRTLFDSIDEGYLLCEVIFDENEKPVDILYLEANPAAVHLAGRDFSGQRMREIDPNYEDYWYEIIGRVALTGEAVRAEHYAEPHGRWFDFYASKVGDQESRCVAIVFQDITERKRREANLAFLAGLMSDFASLATVEEVLEMAGERLAEHLNLSRCAFVEIFPEAGTCTYLLPSHPGGQLEISGSFKLADYHTEEEHQLLCAGHSMVVGDVRDGTRTPEQIAAFEQFGIGSIVNTPYISNGRWVFDLGVTRSSPSVWREDEIELLREISARVWLRIERARAEEALRASEARLDSIANLVPDLLWDSEPDGSTNWYNHRWMEYTGQPFEEAVGWGWTEVIHPNDREDSARFYHEAVEKGKPLRQEHRIRRHDGKYRWFVVNSFPLKDESGRVIKMYGAATDIHESRIALELARESEERMRIAIEASELATWEWNLKANEVIWNDRHFTILGLKPEKNPVHPEDFFKHVHPEDQERVNADLQKSVADKTPFDTKFRVVKRDGSVCWMSGYGRVTDTDDEGNALRMSGVMFDITERRESEEALRKSEEHLNLILESTKDYAIITYNLEGRITRWNKGAEKIFGYDENEVIGQPSSIIFTPEDRKAGVPLQEMENALAKGRAEDERWHLRKDGSRFFASGVMQPLRDGKTEGFVKITRDQTQKIEAENIIREQEMLRRLVGMQEDERRRIARDLHDHLGQQLTALRLQLDKISKTSKDKNLSAYVQEAQKSAAAIDADVDFIAWELRPAALDDFGLRVTLQNFIREWAHHTNIKTDFHTSGLGKTRLSFESETNLYRIAQEALNNIYKHAKAKTASVILEKRKDTIVLIIEDDGIGFNVQDKDNRHKGIGLTGMEERAKILGGEIEIESEKGSGTTVFARVPVKLSKEQDE